MESVRVAVADDADRFEELADELIGWIASQRGGSLLLGQEGRRPWDRLGAGSFAALLADSDRLVVMGTLDGVVTATATGHVVTLEGGDRLGVVDGCYVEEGARGVGLGQLLTETVVAWLDGQGCLGVDALALPGDRTAKQLLETTGFKARLLTMHRSFDRS